MKKILFLLFFAVSVGGAWAQAQDREIAQIITSLSRVRKANESKEKISLPPPYPNYAKLVAFADDLGWDHHDFSLSAGEDFFESIAHNVSGEPRYKMLKVDTMLWHYRELYTATIYIYVYHRYQGDGELRKSIYQRILGEEMGATFFNRERDFFTVAATIANPT